MRRVKTSPPPRHMGVVPNPQPKIVSLPKLAQLANEALDRALSLTERLTDDCARLAAENARLLEENARLQSQLSQIEDPGAMNLMAEKLTILEGRLASHSG